MPRPSIEPTELYAANGEQIMFSGRTQIYTHASLHRFIVEVDRLLEEKEAEIERLKELLDKFEE